MPLIHYFLFALAAVVFSHELQRWGLPKLNCWCCGWSILFGCTSLDQVKELASDAPAAALAVMTITALLRWVRETDQDRRSGWQSFLLVILLATATVSFRPAYLFLSAWVVVAGFLLLRFQGHSSSVALWRPFWLSLCTLVPIVAWMCWRWWAVADFSVLPFGGQNLAGVLVQVIPEERLVALPGEAGSLAREILLERKESFGDATNDAYMNWEGRWDDVTYRNVFPVLHRIYGEDSIAAHRRIQNFNRAAIFHNPQYYGLWLVKALRRGIWGIGANLLMHPLGLLATVAAVLLLFWLVAVGKNLPELRLSSQCQPLLIIALSYAAMKLCFVILTSPPIGRFADAAGILIPSCAIVVARWRGEGDFFRST